jgi:diguanylate cyclase (GGDEF)-like protein
MNLLIVEEKSYLAHVIKAECFRGFDIKQARLAEARSLAEQVSPDCMILMLEFAAELALAKPLIKAYKNIPIIVVTLPRNEVLAAQALRTGAVDYLVLSTSTEQSAINLLQTIEKALDNSEEVVDTIQPPPTLEANLLPGLTQLPVFKEIITHSLNNAQRLNRQAAVLLVKLMHSDKAQQVQKTLPEQTLCHAVMLRMQQYLRYNDIVTRIAEDEFVIFLHEIKHTYDAGVIAKRMLDACIQPFILADVELRLEMNIGIACFPGAGRIFNTLLIHARQALIQAKKISNNHFQYYYNKLQKTARNILLTNELQYALEKNELFLCYQPVYDLSTQKIVAVETLLRWQHPELGVIYPGEFILIAERTGLMSVVGEWIISQACAELAQLPTENAHSMKIFFNVSAKQLSDENFISHLDACLTANQLHYAQIGIELTETALMESLAQSQQVLSELQQRQVQVAVDDFGTGYFSLSHLKYMTFDILKIDRSFVIGLGKDKKDQAIVDTVLALGQRLGVSVVAEGIESAQQLTYLQAAGCVHGQGFYLSKPLLLDEIRSLLMGESEE